MSEEAATPDESLKPEMQQPSEILDQATNASHIFRGVRRVLFWLSIAIGAVLLGAASWIRRTFGPISIDQMLMNLPGAGGAETTVVETGYVASFVWQAIVLPLTAVLLILALALVCRRLVVRRKAQRQESSSGAASRWLLGARGLLAAVALVTGVAVFAQATGLSQYVRSASTALDMADYYVDVLNFDGAQTISQDDAPEERKNLVLIYLESAEDLLTDGSLFESRPLSALEEATETWGRIPSLSTYSGGGWTMAGIVGTQCGIPLRGPGLGVNDINSNEIGAGNEGYLPGASCLGDVLSAEGYTNVFLGGADAEFASKGAFLFSHGYDEVRDLAYWQEAGETDFGTWGLSDRALMEQAKSEVVRLRDAGQPFNLTLLTLDFHEPVHLFDYCELTTEEPMDSVLACSTRWVVEFVDFLGENGFLDDTVVVLMGDHPKMVAEGGIYSDQLGSVPSEERVLFNRVWSSSGDEFARYDIDQLSMYPTMLDLIGIGAPDGRAGLGFTALREQAPAGSAPSLPKESYEELLGSRSLDFYRSLWGLEEIGSPETT